MSSRAHLLAATLLAFACGKSGDFSPPEGAGAGGNPASGGYGGESAGPEAAGRSPVGTGGAAEVIGGASGEAGASAHSAEGGALASGGSTAAGGSGTTSAGNGAAGAAPTGALGPYPFTPSTVTRGGTMTFTNVGAPGSWPRRIERQPGDPACTYKDGDDTWGGHCCMTEHMTTSAAISPFDEEMTLILKAIEVKQLAVYQPSGGAPESPDWRRVSAWDARTNRTENLWFTQQGDGSPSFPGELTHDDCVGYVMQEPLVDCGDGVDYYCPDDPGVLHRGYSGSKLVVLLGSMNFDDAGVAGCGGDGVGKPGPWVAFVASELVRDGGRKWNGLCNCYSKTGSAGDGCGEINVFEVVMDDNAYSNREFSSTGVRSFQAGHVGGAVCGADCRRDAFPDGVEVVDACGQTAYERGPEIAVGGATDGCPVWRRPDGDRYFFILLDQLERTIQVGVIHPARIPASLANLLPNLPSPLARTDIDRVLALRLPAGNE